MRVLILDDDEARHARFAKWFAGYDVHHVYTISEFEKKITGGKFDAVFLDHDLNDYGKNSVVYNGYTTVELTGFEAAKTLTFLPQELRPTQVFVHSWNPDGAKMMVDLLESTGFNVIRWVFDPKAFLKING